MIHKTFLNANGGPIARVTFTLPDSIWADKVYLVGDFNNWSHTAHPFTRNRQGEWVLTVDLDVGRTYQFRYLCDGDHWLNDGDADDCVHNSYGSRNFIVVTEQL